MIELWKNISGYKGVFSVSSKGRIRSNGKSWMAGKIPVKKEGRFIKLQPSKGYIAVSLCNVLGMPQRVSVHRMVAQAFIPNPENKPQVNHINGVKTDNRVENLEWCTAQENQTHAIRIGLNRCLGADNSNSKLTKEQVVEILNIDICISSSIVAKKYNVHSSTIRRIRCRIGWKSIE